MIIILSQKIDTESSYSDDVYKTYHYPSRYRNQIHEGDLYVYYQGNRYDKSQRYYFGIGKVGKIMQKEEDSYYASLIQSHKFENKVPIYLLDGGYIEQLGYETVRKSINPPWQSSIRPISEEAYNYIIKHAGNLSSVESIDETKDRLKRAIQSFFVSGDDTAIVEVYNTAKKIADELGVNL